VDSPGLFTDETLGLGTYHGLRDKHLDAYLNEFAFRYNRRFYRHVSFETMLGIASPPRSCPLQDHRRCVRARTPPNSASDHKISINLSQRDKPLAAMFRKDATIKSTAGPVAA